MRNEQKLRDTRLDAYELPYIPLGLFKLRFPGVHYKIEFVEFFQGILIGATALSAIPYLTEYLGIPYELAWSCVIIETFLYILHATLGDPVVPGWITPTLPLTLGYLTMFDKGLQRIQAMIALQLLVAIIFLFMGVTKLANKFVNAVPTSIKGGILLAAPFTVIQSQLAEDGQFTMYPIAVTAGFCLLALISFSESYKNKREKSKLLDLVAKYGNLFPYLLAMLVGVLVKELAPPQLEIGTIIKIPQFKDIFETVSIFGVGLPSMDMFIQALPLALVSYIIAFGDFVATESLVDEARMSRTDEVVDFNPNRSNIISGIRNLILALFAPFPPLSGPLWAGMTVSITMRYREGKDAMKSLLGGMSSFRLGSFISVILIPIVAFMKPIFPVGSSLTLLFQAFVCAKIGMDYCKTGVDKSIAGLMAAVLATKGSTWGLLVGILLNILLSNFDLKKGNEDKDDDLLEKVE